MADMTTIAPTTLMMTLWDRATHAWAQIARLAQTDDTPKTDNLLQDVGMEKAPNLSPLSQDAMTALHLMSLGQWH